MSKSISAFAAAGAALVLAAGPAAAKTITLTVVAFAPPTVTNVRMTKDKWIPYINAQLAKSGKDFKINWKQAYSGSLAGKNEVLDTVGEGIAQVGVILKNFEPSKLPLAQYFYMAPFNKETIPQAIAIDNELRKKVPALNEQYLKHNQVFLGSAASESTQMFTTFPLTKVSDLKGHKIGASGAMGDYLRGTGAVVVSSSMTNSYTSIRNGLYDGYPISITLAGAFRTYQAAKYYTKVDFGVSATSALTVNKNTWDSFPPFVKKIFREATAKWWVWQMNWDNARHVAIVKKMKADGVKFEVLSDAQRRKWAMEMPNIAKQWAASLDAKGLPGTKVLDTYMDLLRAHHISIARQWDKS